MNPYIEVRCDLFTDPRVKRVAATLDVTVDHVVGMLSRLWSVAYERGERRGRDTVMPHYDRAMYEQECGVVGIVDSLVAVDWAGVSQEGWMVMPRGSEKMRKLKRERLRQYERERKRIYRANHPSQFGPDMSRTVPRKQKQHPKQKQSSILNLSNNQSSRADAAADAAENARGQADAALLPDAPIPFGQPDAIRARTIRLRLLADMGLDPQARARYVDQPGLTVEALADIHKRQKVARIKSNRVGWARRAIDAVLVEAAQREGRIANIGGNAA